MNRGIFYGVGIGPGNPGLLTLAAARVIERCPVIAAPRTESGEMLALSIVRQAMPLEGKTILPMKFTMARNPDARRQAWERAADAAALHLDEGRDVALLNLGDVSLYATAASLCAVLESRGYRTERIAGVPSFCAAAAGMGRALTMEGEPLHILPAQSDWKAAIGLPGTKVLMKSGRGLAEALEFLAEQSLLEKTSLAANCGLPGEQFLTGGEALARLKQEPEAFGYFTTLIISAE